MTKLIPIVFSGLGLIHLAPALAAVSPGRLSTLYGIAPDDTVLLVLMQHRAVLLGLVGAAFLSAATLPTLRWPVLIGGSVSMGTFILIMAQQGAFASGSASPLFKIAVVDGVGLILAALAAFLMIKS